jgi:hypothetical protein
MIIFKTSTTCRYSMSDVPDEHNESPDDDYPLLPPPTKIPFKVRVFTDDTRDTWGSITQAILQDSDSDSDSDVPMLRRVRKYYQMKIQRKLAFCMLLHERLGAQSFYRHFPVYVTRKITDLI